MRKGKPKAQPTTLNVNVVPIVFLPGVMGSRLTIPGGNDWDPDDALGMVSWVTASLDQKTRDLDPFVSPFVTVKTAGIETHEFRIIGGGNEAEGIVVRDIRAGGATEPSRGWAGVAWGFYGPILQFLETTFNIGTVFLTSVINPVYAFGYDWRLSNAINGGLLIAFVQTVLARHPGSSQVILVTHSMGGLVARAAFVLASAFIGQVRGVVHTVQPSNGSVTAYRRFFTGCMSPFDGSGLTDKFLQKIMGQSPDDYAALMGVLPGPMQLLPNHLYHLTAASPWLRTNPPTNLNAIFDVYQGAPFQPGILSPSLLIAFGPVGGTAIQAKLVVRINEAKAFHTALGGAAHPNTFVFFSTGLRSDEVVDFTGADMVQQRNAGDGTVHQISGSCPGLNSGSVQVRLQFQNLEHSAVFKSDGFDAAVVAILRRILSGP